jgi:hypothetical protein
MCMCVCFVNFLRLDIPHGIISIASFVCLF